MPAPSNAELLFREIMSSPPDHNALLKRFVEERRTETEWLEFKVAPLDNEASKEAKVSIINETKLKELWYEALSGFANTGGGVLIWGIDAGPNTDKIDCARALKPVYDFEGLARRLLELSREGTNPPVMGVRCEGLNGGREEKKGYVVCYVPESKYKPHRAETKDKKEYHIRASDSFQVANPALLRQMFYPQTHSYFEIEGMLTSSDIAPNDEHPERAYQLEMLLRNTGTASAHEVFAHVIFNHERTSTAARNTKDWTLHASDDRNIITQCNLVLHPQLPTQLNQIQWSRRLVRKPAWVGQMVKKYLPDEESEPPPKRDIVDLLFNIYLRDSAPHRLQLRFDLGSEDSCKPVIAKSIYVNFEGTP